jgi:hypothetical protein
MRLIGTPAEQPPANGAVSKKTKTQKEQKSKNDHVKQSPENSQKVPHPQISSSSRLSRPFIVLHR